MRRRTERAARLLCFDHEMWHHAPTEMAFFREPPQPRLMMPTQDAHDGARA